MRDRVYSTCPRGAERDGRGTPGAAARPGCTGTRCTRARGALRAGAALDRGGARQRAPPLWRVLLGRQHPDPATTCPHRSRPQVLEPGRHALPRARAPASLRSWGALQGALPADPRLRTTTGHLQAASARRTSGGPEPGAGRAAPRLSAPASTPAGALRRPARNQPSAAPFSSSASSEFGPSRTSTLMSSRAIALSST